MKRNLLRTPFYIKFCIPLERSPLMQSVDALATEAFQSGDRLLGNE
ncbi:hypothetical protein QUB80_31450 [Chlorogloeopsis sp. ULAP01]|nr:hypothetical protein [Chlorogloeopsis sp. ULAP01]MDM9385171.1 hypothetical protein [Chlorogloeopsis sp. ULAP01]